MSDSDGTNQTESTPAQTQGPSEPEPPKFVDWGSSNLHTHGKPVDSMETRHERND
jgi:hypothetical protein